MNILIIIPARGGSKGVPLKNIHPINGKPLIQYTIDFAKNIPLNKEIFVSTDSKIIANIANKLGAETPFLRPPEISTDFIGDMQVLKHGLIEFEKFKKKHYELVIMLQPTSPIRFNHQIISAFENICLNSTDAVISVSKIQAKYHALKQFKIKENKLIPFSQEAHTILARQQLQDSYIRNGIVYIFQSDFIKRSKSVFSNNTGYLVTTEKYVNIDSLEDIEEFKKYLMFTES